MNISPAIQRLRDGLIVSCQSYEGEAFYGPQFMVEFARCAFEGGAVGIRANGPRDIRAIVDAVPLPMIGLYKVDLPGCPVRITPNLDAALQVASAGAHIIALDATRREHPGQLSAASLIRQVQEKTGLPVLADISTFDEGLAAEEAGAAAVSTTLSGYTDYSPQQEAPDFEIIERLSRRLTIPVLAEGRIATGAEARRALDLGAYAVVIGTAITRPQWIVSNVVRGMKKA
ncbi:MAG TPA: N-acetylmannosamine-6-phosphate 2-epimerase [Anaerolineaceae bacterium]|nr:N-acetylmannosamine-6-phosphate 2-epimerase [Anaerolineaceae bacterium]HPN53614.1 N-acetylmannosamine-6-phosphate 2-epimerase [Anaerolineaceae bacterium]